MKRNIFNFMQTCGLRFAACTLVLGLSSMAYAQSEDEDTEEYEAGVIKQPSRQQVKTVQYPTVTIKGLVTELSTGAPLPGVQLRSLGNSRYTAMTEEDGTFTIKVPTFTTALYAFAPQYQAQQVAITAGDSTQFVMVKMIGDKFLPMYGTGTDYTAKRSVEIDRFGVTVDNEIANKLGGDMRSILRSAAVDGGASMFIRGLNSIASEAQPLIVVDGIEMDMQRNRTSLHDGQFNNLLANISPDDVEKVTVLKNATALYGARGANGVVLIETKRGKSMATRIDANVSVGVQFVPKTFTLMNADQYRTYASELLGTVKDVNEYQDFYFLDNDPNGYYYHTYHNNTNWYDEVYREALTQNYSVNVQGGDDVGMYNLSVGYVDAQNTLKKTGFDRMNVRFNTDISITSKLSTKFDIAISRTNNNVFDDGLPANFTDGTVTSLTALAMLKSPLVAPYQYNSYVGGFTSLLSEYDNILFSKSYKAGGTNALGVTRDPSRDGLYYTSQSLANPTAILANGEGDNKNKAENTYFIVHVAPSYKISNDFRLSAEMSYMLNRNAQRYYRPYKGVPLFSMAETGAVTSLVASMFAKEQNVMGRVQLDWSKQIGKHTFNAFIGGRYNNFTFDNSDLHTEYQGVTEDKNPVLSTSGLPKVDGIEDEWANIQWYANLDYNYMNRYFATVSLMTEANSRFGANAGDFSLCGVEWAVFPSVQLGWVLTNEKWFPKKSGINYLRLNAGYDMSGNDDISNYAARTSFTLVKYYNNINGIQLTNIGNDKIQWETTHKFNVGLQSYLIDNRLGVSFDYFYHKTTNLLTQRPFENPIGGINLYWSNGGELTNQGFEAMVTFKPVVTKNWNVEIGASVGHYMNKVTKLPEGFNGISSIYGDENILTSVGNPVALFYGYRTKGIFADDASAKAAGLGDYLYMEDNAGNKNYFTAGDVQFVDVNGDGRIDENDKTVIGNPNPDYYGNIFAMVNWKNLTLSVGFNYSVGNDVYNYQRSVLNAGSAFYNQQVAEVNRWRYEGQVADLPKATFGDPLGNNRFSDRWIEDGSYLRLKTVNLSYKVPVPGSWTWLQGLTIWAEAQNLFTFTRYLGTDPEFSMANGVMYQGIDCGRLAHGRSIMGGLKINL